MNICITPWTQLQRPAVSTGQGAVTAEALQPSSLPATLLATLNSFPTLSDKSDATQVCSHFHCPMVVCCVADRPWLIAGISCHKLCSCWLNLVGQSWFDWTVNIHGDYQCGVSC